MGTDMSKIVSGVYVGNYQNASLDDSIETHGITHILSVHNFSEDVGKKHTKTRILKRINLKDADGENISQYFPECNDFIHKARLSKGHCLIHCLAGISRSVTVTCAYIMSVTQLTFSETLTAIQGARPGANPNRGFRRQLVEFEKNHLDSERNRLKEKFGVSPFLEEDMQYYQTNIQARQEQRNKMNYQPKQGFHCSFVKDDIETNYFLKKVNETTDIVDE